MRSIFFRTTLAFALSATALSGLAACSDSSDTNVDADSGKAISSLDIGGDRTVDVGATEQMTATVKYADGTTKDVTKDGELVWNVGDTGVATVSSDGVVKGVAFGSTSVKATYQKTESTSHTILVK